MAKRHTHIVADTEYIIRQIVEYMNACPVLVELSKIEGVKDNDTAVEFITRYLWRTLNGPQKYEHENLVEQTPNSLIKMEAIKSGIFIGYLVSQFDLVLEKCGTLDMRGENYTKLNEIVAGIHSILYWGIQSLELASKHNREAKSTIRQEIKLRINVALYLQGEFPKLTIHAHTLHTQSEYVKKKGREFLRHELGGNIKAETIIKEVFRKPRKSDAKYEATWSDPRRDMED
jgi:hypothetical protein